MVWMRTRGNHLSEERLAGGERPSAEPGRRPSGYLNMGTSIALGAALGLLFGTMLNNLTWGLIIGAALGVVLGAIVEAQRKKQ
jgi:uncharacterized membrane protein